MTTPEEVERVHTLSTAVARFEDLRTREVLAPQEMTLMDTLELLALAEVIARKAGYGRQLSVRRARAAGASWSQIGAALGTSKQAAWETHTRWIDELAERHRRSGLHGLDPGEAAAARDLAGDP